MADEKTSPAVLDVTAAVILEQGRLLLATRKAGGAQAGLWEFPGGKVKSGETLVQTIRREMQEELRVDIAEACEMLTLVHHYPEKSVRLHFMACTRRETAAPLLPQEGQTAEWVTPAALPQRAFAGADRRFVEAVRQGAEEAAAESTEESGLLCVVNPRVVNALQRWLNGAWTTADAWQPILPLPSWMHISYGANAARDAVAHVVDFACTHTVCVSAHCPNLAECWANHTATFMILGDVCTRRCRFCAVGMNGQPLRGLLPIDASEPQRIAEAVRALRLRHAVVTCVSRDDLPDGGADAMAQTVREIKRLNPETRVEVLVSDYNGDEQVIGTVLSAPVDVFGHNMETVRRLTPRVRSVATYERSLGVLRQAVKWAEKNRPALVVKTGLMLGLGETEDELAETLMDLRACGVTALTLGQYLQPSPGHYPVQAYILPEEFDTWRLRALNDYGFSFVQSGPFVRSSYHAAKPFMSAPSSECP